jgi:CelD/BcsL family acetyltransferase involved in cellulose biosynthesis
VFSDGQAEYIRHRPLPASEGDGDSRWDLYASCELVASANGQSHTANGGTLGHERVGEYLRASHAVAARLGMLDVHVLNIEGRPMAFLYGYHRHGNVTALRTGFNSSNDNEICSALILQAIHDSCNRGDHTIDLGPGEQEIKRQLRTRTESTFRITYTPLASWRSQAVRLTRWAKRRLPNRAEAAAS